MKESLKVVVREEMEAQFYPDPAKDDFSESDKFKVRRNSAAKLFMANLDKKDFDPGEVDDAEILDAVQKAVKAYHSQVQKERKQISNGMVQDISDIHKLYLKLLALPIELAHIEKLEQEKKQKAHINRQSYWQYNFIQNPLVDALTKDDKFNKELLNLKISWEEHLDQIRSWYKDIIRKDETIIDYQSEANLGVEKHKEALVYLFKSIVFKNESINEFLSALDLHWSENRNILRSLVAKTFQDYDESLDPPFELKEVSKNEEEDMEFFNILFKETINNNDELDDLIQKNVKNWDISRVAITDRIILKMALTEMMQFPGIPVKVSINEFIEISKQYSTPKSKQFINGILDVLANELTSKGVIKKSGRGLIDNK